jgi:hypothetical protein
VACEYFHLFGYGQGQFPIRYLGISIHYRRLAVAKLKLVEERLQKHLSSWKGKLLFLRGRLVLINSILTSMILYMLSFFMLQKNSYMNWITTSPDSFGIGITRKKYQMDKWRVLYRLKDKRGRCLANPPKKKICWIKFIHSKSGNSHFWLV